MRAFKRTTVCVKSPVDRIAVAFPLVARRQGDLLETAEPRSCVEAFTWSTISMATRSQMLDTEQFIMFNSRNSHSVGTFLVKNTLNKTKKQDAWLKVCIELYQGFDTFEVDEQTQI